MTACGLIAGLNTEYVAAQSTDGGVSEAEDASLPTDAGARVDAVVLTDAAVDSFVEACAPRTCVELGFTCGTAIPDGCGGLISSCGACPDASSCGGGGGPNKCGSAPCTPAVCTSDQCGAVADGCGGRLSCPTNCTAPMQCKGGGCGGCVKDGAQCAFGQLRWPAWLCDDTGSSRGGGCNRAGDAKSAGQAYYCCPPF